MNSPRRWCRVTRICSERVRRVRFADTVTAEYWRFPTGRRWIKPRLTRVLTRARGRVLTNAKGQKQKQKPAHHGRCLCTSRNKRRTCVDLVRTNRVRWGAWWGWRDGIRRKLTRKYNRRRCQKRQKPLGARLPVLTARFWHVRTETRTQTRPGRGLTLDATDGSGIYPPPRVPNRRRGPREA